VKWIPINEDLPVDSDWYLVTTKNMFSEYEVKKARYCNKEERFLSEECVIAWQHLPEPYSKTIQTGGIMAVESKCDRCGKFYIANFCDECRKSFNKWMALDERKIRKETVVDDIMCPNCGEWVTGMCSFCPDTYPDYYHGCGNKLIWKEEENKDE